MAAKAKHDYGKQDAGTACEDCEDCGLSRDLAIKVPVEIKQPCDKRLVEGFAAGYARGYQDARQAAARVAA